MSKWCNGNSLGCNLEFRSSNPRSADHFSETNIILGPSNDKLDHVQAWVFSLCFEKLANLGHYLEFFFSRISSLIRVFFHFFHSSFSKSRPFFLFFEFYFVSFSIDLRGEMRYLFNFMQKDICQNHIWWKMHHKSPGDFLDFNN